MAYLDTLKEILGITDSSQDTVLQLFCDASEREIADAMGLETLSVTSYTDKVEIEDMSQYMVRMPRTPIVSITSITDDGDAIDVADVHIKAGRWVILDAKSTYFTAGRQSVEFEYTAGYATVPSDLQVAVVFLAKDMYENGSDGEKQSETIGAYSYKKFEKGGGGQSLWPTTVQRIVTRYLPIIPGR